MRSNVYVIIAMSSRPLRAGVRAVVKASDGTDEGSFVDLLDCPYRNWSNEYDRRWCKGVDKI
jgi:hypothetical protein